MTKNEARDALAATWRFSRVGEFIALREVELIEAVRAYETVASPGTPGTFDHTRMQPPQPS